MASRNPWRRILGGVLLERQTLWHELAHLQNRPWDLEGVRTRRRRCSHDMMSRTVYIEVTNLRLRLSTFMLEGGW